MNTEVKIQSNIDDNPAVLEALQHVNSMRGTGNFNNMLPISNIEIPQNVVIGCPLARQHLIRAVNCKACNHFNGVVQTTYNNEYEMLWHEKFAISCVSPVDRKCSTVCID
jgi:RNase H-fold protein (predicted Holliday junction resolvase)